MAVPSSPATRGRGGGLQIEHVWAETLEVWGIASRRSSADELIFRDRVEFVAQFRGLIALLMLGSSAILFSVGFVLALAIPRWTDVYIGGAVVALIWICTWFLQQDGAHYRRNGADAERWTSVELRRFLRNKGHWRILDDLRFEDHNIDHVLVGPGGVYVVETKWHHKYRGRSKTLTADALYSELAQVKRNAEDVKQMLDSLAAAVEVRPVLVLWGPGYEHVDRGAVQFGRSMVLLGGQSKEWPSYFDRYPMDEHAIEEVATRLQAQVDTQSQLSQTVYGLRRPFQLLQALLRGPRSS